MTDEDIITVCEKHDAKLSNWEREFLQSIRSQLEGGRSLTEKQIRKLDAIWHRVEA